MRFPVHSARRKLPRSGKLLRRFRECGEVGDKIRDKVSAAQQAHYFRRSPQGYSRGVFRGLLARGCKHGLRPFVLTLVGLSLAALAPQALARDVYVANSSSDDASVIDTATNQLVGMSIPVVNGDQGSMAMAITPDGKRAYVANYDVSGAVSVIDTTTNQAIGAPIAVSSFATAVAITPDGKRAYVADGDGASVIDTATNQVVAHIPMVDGSFAIAITPDGTRAYAADYNQNNVSVIDTATNQVIGTPISVGSGPVSVAITPDGKRAYTANHYINGTVSVIDTATNDVVGSPIAVGRDPDQHRDHPRRQACLRRQLCRRQRLGDRHRHQPGGRRRRSRSAAGPSAVAITPDGKRAYVANYAEDSVSVIDLATNQVIGAPILVGIHPHALAIVPDQPPVASFAGSLARPGVPIVFSAAASTDPDGSIARYDWAFGDGETAVGGDPSQSHTYAAPGNYQGTLTLTDNEGCSTALIFTGQTAYCNGSAVARQTQALKVAFPALRVKCPKRAGGRGCKFKLRAVTKRRKGRPETAVARAKVKGGQGRDPLAQAEAGLRRKACLRGEDPGQGGRDDQAALKRRSSAGSGSSVSEQTQENPAGPGQAT